LEKQFPFAFIGLVLFFRGWYIELIFLSTGGFAAKDGQDVQDDYTLPIEKKLWRKSLDSIMRHWVRFAGSFTLSIGQASWFIFA